MSSELSGMREMLDVNLRNCNNRIVLFATISHRFESTSSKHAKQEVAIRNLSVVPTDLKTKGKRRCFFSNNRQIIIIFMKNDTFCCIFW